MVRSDPAWRGGNYEPGRGPRPACGWRASSARSPIARPRNGSSVSAASASPRTPRRPGDFRTEFEVESYLENQASEFAGIFDANCYLYISRAMDQFDLPNTARLAGRRVRKIPRAALAGHRRRDTTCFTRSTSSVRSPSGCARRGREVEFHAFPSLAGPRLVPGRPGAFRAGDRQVPEVDLSAAADGSTPDAQGCFERRCRAAPSAGTAPDRPSRDSRRPPSAGAARSRGPVAPTSPSA